jgi:predicted signal transduction protein with EAL and GGDEF domain/HAMP domain-containing protein
MARHPDHHVPRHGGISRLRARLRPDRVLLRSRFGRRLLGLFLVCALLPTLAVALLSFVSVRAQLSEQTDERLQALALASGHAVYERLALLEADARRVGLRLAACLRGAGTGGGCAEEILYAVTDAVAVRGGRPVPLAGALDPELVRQALARAGVGPGRSAVVQLAWPGQPTILLVHHAAGPDPAQLVGLVDPAFLWSAHDADLLPAGVRFAIWEPVRGTALASGEPLDVPAGVQERMAHSATGAFRWSGADGPHRAAYWTFPSSRRLHLPPWRLVLSQPEAEVFAPMADFARTFPVVLVTLALAVVGFGLSRIRRRVIPLEALHEGTRRLARQDYEARVAISSGDEIEELASSFNAMAATVDRQISALRTAAEIDRAVLSRVDRTEIVETALARLPELAPCRGAALFLLDAGEAPAGTLWTMIPGRGVRRGAEPVGLSAAELDVVRGTGERLRFPPDDPSLPAFAMPPVARASTEVYPFRFGDDVHGALVVYPPAGAGGLSGEEAVQVRRFTDQVAVALGNARMVERVRFLAFYDSLTGLPNRLLYKERLGQALLRAERRRCHVALCFLDLDQFSTINDSLGHDLGDALIEQVAARLMTVCRDSDTVARLGGEVADVEVARLGGDEFTVVLPDLADPQDASRVARRLLACFREPFRLGTHEVFVSTSIGVAVYPEDGRDIDDLLKNADVAMYHAKEQGRNTYRMFSASMNAEAVARLRLEQQLRRSVEAGEFTLVYQPIVDLRTGRVAGGEALVRWNHPERGLVSPGEFITLSEESGLIVRLGEWILRTVCEQAAAWQGAGAGPVYAAVNLSARQLQDEDVVTSVRAILEETGLSPRQLVLELTESVLMQPTGHVAASIEALAGLGVRFALDDFGTGYSSLSYLKHFPVGTLKIDRSFVRHVAESPDDAAIASAIVALGRALDLEVVAEGVETVEQARFLASLGCHKMQGFLVGQPLTPDSFRTLVASRVPLEVGAAPASGQPAGQPAGHERVVAQVRAGSPHPVDLA